MSSVVQLPVVNLDHELEDKLIMMRRGYIPKNIHVKLGERNDRGRSRKVTEKGRLVTQIPLRLILDRSKRVRKVRQLTIDLSLSAIAD